MKQQIVVLVIVVLVIAGFIFWQVNYQKENPCIKSHIETQYKAPLSVVAGGSKYGGGIAIPVGNMKPVQVEVCDVYK